jgi:hypothetical protein
MRAADETAYCDFIAARRRSLLQTAFLFTGDWHAAEDLVQISDQLSQVVDWAAEHDVRMDKTVWTSAQAITDGEWTVEGRSIADHAPQELRCGRW